MTPKNQLIVICMSVVGFAACNNQPAATAEANKPAEAAKPADAAKADSKMCFMKAEKKDTTTVSLTIDGDEVTGEMVWNPYQKDGATGKLSGKKNAVGELELVYDYMIEGSNQSETKVMKIENDELLIKKGELVDAKNDGHMTFKDVTKAKFSEKLSKTACK